MNYKSLMGYGDKKKKSPKHKKNKVLEGIKNEFNLNEGPSYDYVKYVKNIEKAEKLLEKQVMTLKKVLMKKGLSDEGKALSYYYSSFVSQGRKSFMKMFDQMLRKLM